MKPSTAQPGRKTSSRTLPTRTRRRCILTAAYALLAAAVLSAAWPARAQTPAASPSPSAVADARSHFQKARDFYQDGKYAEAQAENKQALALDPTNSQSVLLAKVLADKIASTGGAVESDTKTTSASALPVLTAQQIAAIRVAELSPTDRNIRGRVDHNALEDFWQNVLSKDSNNPDTSPEAKAAFLNPGNFAGQVRAIRHSDNPHYMSQVTLTSDPAVIVGAAYSFQNLQTYMLQNCATSECHAGDKAGNFRLIPIGVPGVSIDQERFTNFFIMAMYKNADGNMIDRENPEKSLFITYGLPKGHPTVSIPAKLQSGDVQYRHMIDWIKSLAFPKPTYGISYAFPGKDTESAPATAPAPAP